jgi:hypothetical protein
MFHALLLRRQFEDIITCPHPMTGGRNMSAFLGPIHFWLYDKIKIQNEIVEEILDYAEKNNENIRSELYAKFGDGDLKPLSEVIDVTNIHGWLQERVARVERKLAYLVPKLIDNNPDDFNVIKDIFESKGAEVSTLDKDSSLEEAYKGINDTLLDGMPCDRANSVILSGDNDDAIFNSSSDLADKNSYMQYELNNTFKDKEDKEDNI